ncbi:E3 SUMO-protein ligase KIAA1586-like isoform X1 [Ambystoma mexicanum]|uniref:E3 SUMO-protein ligase KIAA1586-like isoform X1 n=1 Tax=Ambystoma mexicanum TaxID=8296 RepID=UPI0037E7136C
MSGAQKKMSSYFSKPGKKCSTDEPTSKRSKQESGSKSDSVCEEPEKTLDETTSTTTVNIHTEIQTASIPLGEELGGTGTYEDRELPNDSDTEIPSTSTPESGQLSLLQHSAPLTKGPLLPKGWKLDQKQYFQTKYPWLIVRGHTLGCSTCRQVNSLGAEKSHGMKLSKEWTECTVSSFGTNKDKQQRSLRKKIAEHFSTKAHVTASKILEQAKKDTLLKVTSRAQARKIATTARIFRTAYKEAKRNRPAYCQQLNGLDMGRILHSNVACSSIQQHISSEMKRKTFAKIVASSPKVTLLLDEPTALNKKKSVLIVYLCTQLQDMESPAHIFVDLIELSDVSAEGIVNSLLSSLQKDPIKISEDFLTKCLVSIACDGASVMFGRNSGVVKRLQ